MLTEPKGRPAAAGVGPVEVRRLRDTDSFEELTSLLHRAYRAQVEMGLRPLAGRQDVETTRKRCSSGECYVALLPGAAERLVGTILFHEVEDAKGPPWFQNRFVDSFSQFGVDPDLQGRGIGQVLLDTAERRARDAGATELGLSMAEPDVKLMEFYKRRGYRFIEFWQWPYTNYRSAILSKTLSASR
jgi:GNAT superfamily N-acetyltransferase